MEAIRSIFVYCCCLTCILILSGCGGAGPSVKGDRRNDAELRRKLASLEKQLAELERKTSEIRKEKRTVPIFIGRTVAGTDDNVVILKERGAPAGGKKRGAGIEARKETKGKANVEREKRAEKHEEASARSAPPEKESLEAADDASGPKGATGADEGPVPRAGPVPDAGEKPPQGLPGSVELIERGVEKVEKPAGAEQGTGDNAATAGEGDEPPGKEDNLEKWSQAVHFQAGVVHQSQLKQNEALAEYKKALKLDPENALAHFNAGTIYEGKGKDSLAIRSYVAATKFHPGYAEAFLNLGVLHHKRGEYKKAVKNYGRSVSLDKSLSRAYVGLGGIYEKHIVKPDQALIYYRKYMDLCGDTKAEELVAERIAALEKKISKKGPPKKKEKKEKEKEKQKLPTSC
ncbi:MAG: tetratricopeptide repeat protein [Candidatus Tritonobacter lacicola]|nr:tetratricopeptide repeat protein [Candidatus Tritonobacter lacicola]